MEERLFWIGLAMGAYAWLSKRWRERGAINSAAKAGLWHGLFCAMAGFSITIVLAMSMENRGPLIGFAANAYSAGEVYPSLAVGLVCGLLGFWRGRKNGGAAARREHILSEDWEWAETVFSAVLLAAVLMYFVVQAFKIPSGSMRQTFLEGDHLFVNKFIYGVRVPYSGRRLLPFRPVKRGDIVVFRFPSDNPKELHCGSIQYGKDFIKRVVGLPGDTVDVHGGRVIINGQLLEETYTQYTDPFRQPPSVRAQGMLRAAYQDLWVRHVLDRELEGVMRDQFGPVKVPQGSYMVMGDNRDHSCDSRYWGPVETRYLKGKAWFIYWPPSRMGAVR